MELPPSLPPLPLINPRHHALTRWLVRRLHRHCGVRLRLHGLGTQFAQGGGLIVANHFTRLETFAIPYVLYREAHVLVRVLADPMFFTNKRVGHYLVSIGGLPTTYPHKYEAIARDILHGGWWLIFPEGSMIKDRKVLARGRLQVSDATGRVRRPPHSGAARIALTVQRYQAALRHALRTGQDLERLCTTLGLDHLSPTPLSAIAQRPAAIVPLNVTYYPLTPQATRLTSWLTRLVPALLHVDLRARLVEELTVEGAMLLNGVDMDMRLGAPLGYAADRQPDAPRRSGPASRAFWQRGIERWRAWRPAPRALVLRERWGVWARQRQRRRARQLTRRYMHAVYGLTTVNLDHLLSGLLLLQVPHQRRVDVTELKRRVYVVLQTLREDPTLHLHADLTDPELQHRLLTAQQHPGVDSFAQRAVAHRLLTCTETVWECAHERLTTAWPFGEVRLQNFMQVCANELEPLPAVRRALRQAVRLDLERQRTHFAQALWAYEQQLYDTDYAAFATAGLSRLPPQPMDVGRPVLLPGHGPAGALGVLLMHGYSASPAEMRPLAHFLHAQGLTVYVVRLRGHGTSPYDLHTRTWQDWYAAVLRGYSCLQAWSRWQFAGGMSTGGALALYLAAQGIGPLQGVFAVGAPLTLQRRGVRLAPVVQTVRAFVRDEPENREANYADHPVQGVRQLLRFIEVYQAVLPHVTVPVLLIQARGDPTVRPDSAPRIYARLQSLHKQLLWKECNRHVIVSQQDADVHRAIFTFLQHHSPLGGPPPLP
jgi:esterase/lipase/1-acyl-sn-glycerol-3-phosphate acyltransferase